MTELQAGAFAPSPGDPDISVAWLEFHGGSFQKQVDTVCRDMSHQREVRKKHKLALLEVGEIKSIGADRGYSLDVAHDPWNGYECHALINGIPLRERIIPCLSG